MSRTNHRSPDRRRSRAPNRAADHLAALRERNEAQQEQALERERRVDQALRDYARAGARLAAADDAHAARVADLEERLARLQADHERAGRDDVLRQARAALTVHECGRTVADLAELLATSEKAVSKMLRRARATDAAAPDGGDAAAMVAPGIRSASSPGDQRPSSAAPDTTQPRPTAMRPRPDDHSSAVAASADERTGGEAETPRPTAAATERSIQPGEPPSG
jgi:hypothetical protein